MRNSTNFVVLLTLGASLAYAGCSSSDTSSASGGATNHAGTGSTVGGSGGTGSTVGGSGGTGSTVGGSGGTGTVAGSGGTATGGSSAAGSGGAATGGTSAAGSGGAAAGSGGGGVDCADESTGVGTGAGVTTAVVLIDDIQVSKAGTVAAEWQFADDKQIKDVGAGDTPPADAWARLNYADPNRVSGSADAHDTFIACAGNPAAGSIKNVIPFTADNQFYEVRVVGAEQNLSGATISAKVKLVGGGAPSATCAAHALVYVIDNMAPYAESTPSPVTLTVGKWMDASLTVPATGFEKVNQLGIRITTYTCAP